MKRLFVLLPLLAILCLCPGLVGAQNPFTSKSASPAPVEVAVPKTPVSGRVVAKITQWQFQLREKMSALIREASKGGDPRPLLLLLGIAFAYGAVHAAGPGHGKFVAASFVLSHKTGLTAGLLFSVFVAFLHGFTGAAAVLGLRLILGRSTDATLSVATDVTQIASFGLIMLLGLGISLKCAWGLIRRSKPDAPEAAPLKKKSIAAWAAAVGLVPCPAVVMVMLFCLAMDALALGGLMAVCISLGMAATLSAVVVVVLMGKERVVKTIPSRYAETIEGWLGALSGLGVALFGALFLFVAIHSMAG